MMDFDDDSEATFADMLAAVTFAGVFLALVLLAVAGCTGLAL